MTRMSDSSGPTYIYKLVPSSAPDPPFDELPERLPVSDLDKNSGFIHLSTARQVPGTLKFFFADDPKVYVLRLRYDAMISQIRWEDPKAEVCGPRGDEGMFPHLYNGLNLGRDEIEGVYIIEKTSCEGDSGGNWDEALKKADSWLVY
ncbi:hypothetical protein A7U60_g3364 [Sanghuangporus baumii]|uniref:Uncharacterized protein n=1 Tax=Sanghuangporus baumii TaxID=108892 RepID=A0A9Q5I0V9_SANBA|nr:hypothetical protein A7U60_g3364 [Sanghuangporus baumii]